MATVYRRLLAPNKKNEQLLILVVKHGNTIRLDYSSGIKLHSKFWNKHKHVKRKFEGHEKINNQVASMEAQIQIIVNQMVINKDELKARYIKRKLNNEFRRGTQDDDNTKHKEKNFYNFCDTFICQSCISKKKATVDTYRQTVNTLKSFRPKLDFNDITLDFYNMYIMYLRKELNMLDNTIGKHIKNLKAILNEATEQSYNTNLTFRSRRFKTFREQSDSVYLTKYELKLMAEVNLTARPGLDKVRDLFLIGCNTGLRFSDLEHLTKDNIVTRDDGQYILIRTQKTEKQVMIPVNATVRAIIDKYQGEVPGAISNQKMNAFLKEIGKLAGIDSRAQVSKKRAGVLEKYSYKKYQLITTHTARRSFATNAYLSGVPALAIMKITGHKSESSFMKYIKGSQEENAYVLSKHPFFH